MRYFITGFSFLFVLFFAESCKKDAILTDTSAKLSFSTDTLTFDTVFTTLGSATRLFKFYNPQKEKLNISRIMLGGGSGSNFRINVDGVPGVEFTDVEILPEDSLYVFVEVTIDPNNLNNPLVIYDSVMFMTNGNTQNVILEAYGQDAHFFRDTVICNTTWMNDKPYVIINSLLVDSNCKLTIQPGCRIYSGANSGIFVKGSIDVMGAPGDSVIFQGLRLEPFYDDLPGQWLGIFPLRGSQSNRIQHAVIKNSTFGVSIGSNDNPDLTTFTNSNAPDILIRNSVIKNALNTGIFGFLSFIRAENCLVYNCGGNNIQIAYGGLYNFIHCTFANYSSATITHRDPIVQIGNFVESPQGFFSANVDANFINCIIYGSEDEEISLDDDEISDFSYLFQNCLLKTEFEIGNANFITIIKNQDPQFINVSQENYSLQLTSPAIDAGLDISTSQVNDDILGGVRPLGPNPDIGAYEVE